ncbi:MAG: hypothetical protein JNM14_02075 [Ferruginibacter sp.]|nr:hypothetical protein [Ferruginibacter sp.]
MQYCKYYITGFFVLLFSAASFAQPAPVDMTGLWTGLMFNDTTELNYRYEIAISEKNGKLTGYSQTFFNFDGQEYYGVKKIKITIDGNKIVTQDLKLIENNYPVKPPKGVYVLNVLNFEMKNDVMMLSGMFQTNRTKEYAPATGYVHVEKKIDHKESPLVKQLKKMGLTEELSFVTPEKPADVIAAKAEVKAEPVAITKPAEKEKPADAIPEKKEIVKEQPVVKTNTSPVKPTETKPVKTEPVKAQPTAKAKPAEIKKPAEETIVKTKPKEKEPPKEQEETKAKEPVSVKENPVTKAPEVKAIPQAGVKQPAAEIKGRIIETIQSVNYTSDSLMISLYDNGEVDGDTVSVLMNGNVIMPRVGLSTNAVRKTIYTKDITDSIQIVMYAENLGSLAPNTGLLIVYDGRDRYEIRFSGDLKKNAAIVFKRKER